MTNVETSFWHVPIQIRRNYCDIISAFVLKVSGFRMTQSRRKRDELVRMAADIFVQTGKKAGNLERLAAKYSAN